MAAPRSTRQEADSESSEEDLERLREAAWEPPGPVKKTAQHVENSAFLAPSLRCRPDSHEHDWNELQTTPEFRAHVAKKLAAMLDCYIKETPGNNSFNQEFTATSDSEDEGFRLLTTSVPGDSGKILPSTTLNRRVASSTSEDSEEEKQRRCSEAAVSGFDILRNSALQTIPMEIIDTANNNQPKKKKKKKAKKEIGLTDETDDYNTEPQGEINVLKKKKKKKKKKKQRRTSDETQSEDQAIPSQSYMESKKNKRGLGDNNKADTVLGGSKKKKKEMGLNKETVSKQNVKQLGRQGGPKNKKKKVVVEHCNECD
ncbi:protein CUSTOS [Anomaloglossus baeobatrachus]|uniref:protein CUSTOS n=1 Tax=Anomaloglossus baeobatrachus TaxID=238106 RepID=UPI003F4FB0DF